MDQRAQTSSPVLTVGDAEGDGAILRVTPPPFRGMLRRVANGMSGQRIRRLTRAAAQIYPILQKLEDRALPADQRVLQGVSFAKALEDDACIERGLRLFVSAWRNSFLRLLDDAGKPIPPTKAKTHMGACGLTVEQGQTHFIDLALMQIFKAMPKSGRRLLGTVSDPDALAKMRVLAQFQQASLTELFNGLGAQAGPALSEAAPDRLYAMAVLQPFHLRALRLSLGAGFRNVLAWSPELIRALSTSFTCPEQVQDMGEALAMVKTPQAMAALGAWEVRDITDLLNEERKRRGQDELRSPRYETDIGAARRILGAHFAALMEEPPELLTAFGKIVSNIRRLEKVDRANRIEEVRLFCERYLSYMPPEALKALGMADANPTSFGEILYICEGLFTKPGLGRKFFEGPLQTPEGVRALVGLKQDIEEMRKRGSIKGEPEIGQLIANSDILDRAVLPFISFK